MTPERWADNAIDFYRLGERNWKTIIASIVRKAVADEREECAIRCESEARSLDRLGHNEMAMNSSSALRHVAATIRARTES